MTTEPQRPAVFLDRDGTLIEDRGHLDDAAAAVFFRDTFAALRLLQPAFALYIVTHQPGIAQGIVAATAVDGVNQSVTDRLEAAGIRIDAVYCCPHDRADGCACIKPNPHFPQLAADTFGIDLTRSFVIGDHPHDEELGRRCGATGIYVLTGHGRKHLEELPADAVIADGIGDAAVGMALSEWTRQHAAGDLPAALSQAADMLAAGGIVAFPTETVYGLGASAFDASAAARVFEAKNRPSFDPLIVHVHTVEQAAACTTDFPDIAQELADRFWPGPLTLVMPKTPKIPDLVTAGLPTVAVRMPNHPVALDLIRRAGVPLAAPIANPFGALSPTTADHVRRHLGDKVDAVLDGGACPVGVESTIVSLAGKRPVLLRPGGIPAEAIERVVGRLDRPDPNQKKPAAPGQLPSHYAPRTPLYPADANHLPTNGRVGLLALHPPADADAFAAVEVLSPRGDLCEAAANLFAALHRLDALGLDAIVAESMPNEGLGVAINDRLQRAAATRNEPHNQIQTDD